MTIFAFVANRGDSIQAIHFAGFRGSARRVSNCAEDSILKKPSSMGASPRRKKTEEGVGQTKRGKRTKLRPMRGRRERRRGRTLG